MLKHRVSHYVSKRPLITETATTALLIIIIPFVYIRSGIKLLLNATYNLAYSAVEVLMKNILLKASYLL